MNWLSGSPVKGVLIYSSLAVISRNNWANILISMTQQGDPYENRTGGPAIAERVNGILKTDFRLNRVFNGPPSRYF